MGQHSKESFLRGDMTRKRDFLTWILFTDSLCLYQARLDNKGQHKRTQ